MDESPPYVNDALRWVAAEVRFPLVEQLSTGTPPGFREQIRETFPIHEEQTELAVTVGAGGPGAQQVVKQRFLTRNRLRSVTVGRDSIVLETTQYAGWTNVREEFAAVLAVLEGGVSRPDGILRVGLRYLDEIRIPNAVTKIADWEGWIDERLLAPFTLDKEELPTNATVVLQYGAPPGYVTVFRAAPLPEGRTVLPEGPLRMPIQTPDGPYFLLDTDASWADPERQVPEFSAERITEILDDLHKPCKRLFESSITDRLRTEVLNQPRQEVEN